MPGSTPTMRSLPPAYSVVDPIPAPKKFGNALDKSIGLAHALPTTNSKNNPATTLHAFTSYPSHQLGHAIEPSNRSPQHFSGALTKAVHNGRRCPYLDAQR